MAKFALQRFLQFAFASDRQSAGRRRHRRGNERHHLRNRFDTKQATHSGDAFPMLPPLPPTAVAPDAEAPPLRYSRLQQDICHGMWYSNAAWSNEEAENFEHEEVSWDSLRDEGESLLKRLGYDVKNEALKKDIEGLLHGLDDQVKNMEQTQKLQSRGIMEEGESSALKDRVSEASPFIQYFRHELKRVKWSIAGREELEDDHDEYRTFLAFYYKEVMPLVVKAGDRDHFPVSGNIYMYMALKDFGRSSGLIQTSRAASSWRMKWVRMAGFLVIGLLQIFAPFAIMVYAMSPLQVEFHLSGHFDFFPWTKDDPDWGISFQTQRVLGILFLFLFVLNGVFVLKSDNEETKKMMFMCRVFEEVAEKNDDWDQPQYRWLWVGAFINVICLLACSVCMFFLFILASADKGPKDIVFDSLGLAFLYNLDDIGGDLTLLDEEWDEDMVGDIYGGLADNSTVMERLEQERRSKLTPDNIYQVGEFFAIILLVALPVLYAFSNDITPVQPQAGEAEELKALKATVQNLGGWAKEHGWVP